MAEISDSNVETRAGSGSISIDPNGDFASLPNTTMKVSDIGTLSIEYDLEENEKDVRNILFTPTKFKFKVFDKLGDGSSLFESLDDISDSTASIDVDFSFTTDGGESWTDELIFNKNNVEYDRARREVTIEARYYNRASSETVTTIFDNYPAELPGTDEETFNDGNSTHSCMIAYDFIRNVFDANESPGMTRIISSDNFRPESEIGDGDDTWVVLEDHDGLVYKQEKNANTVLYRLAAADGAIVGQMMGYIYYCYRLNTENNVSLSQSDASSLKINLSLSNYSSVICFLGMRLAAAVGNPNPDSWFSIGALYQESDGINEFAPKSLYINYYMLELQPATYDLANDEYDDAGSGATSDTGADIDVNPKDGDRFFSVDADPSLVDGDFITIANDPTQVMIVESSDADSFVTYDPWRGARGTPLGVFEYVSFETTLAGGAAEAYAKAYGADGSRRIEIEFLDIDTLKPYETFQLDSTFPNAVQNQTFRPSELEYDLQADKIKVKAYQIS